MLIFALVVAEEDFFAGSDNIKRYYRQDLSAYYFDRNREAFDAIVSFYLSGMQDMGKLSI